MYNMFHVILACIAAALISVLTTPLVKKMSLAIGAVDHPNERRVNTRAVPTMGGIAIFVSFFFTIFFLVPIPNQEIWPIFIGSCIILITGIIDDLKGLSPKLKMLGISAAASVVYFMGNIQLNMMTLPLFGELHFGSLSFPVTLFWILAITNAVNLIDGLDGLASGVSMIALTTMGIIGYFFLTVSNMAVPIMIFVFVASIAGFLPYNFNPAHIFLGDTGALFLGFIISVMSLQGLKNATLITLIIPVVILGIPITDTIYAMIRRVLNKQSIATADKLHIHHRLMSLGFTHKQTVFAIYCLAAIFSLIALLYPVSTLWGSVFLTIGLGFGLELFVELIGLTGKSNQPLLKQIRRFARSWNRKD